MFVFTLPLYCLQTAERVGLARALELLWKGFLLCHAAALHAHRAFQTRAHTHVPAFDLHFYSPTHQRHIDARARAPEADDMQLAVRAAQQTRFPNMDLLRLHLKTAALQKVNLNVQGDNVRLSSQIASFRAQLKAIENETEIRVFQQCAAAGTRCTACFEHSLLRQQIPNFHTVIV